MYTTPRACSEASKTELFAAWMSVGVVVHPLFYCYAARAGSKRTCGRSTLLDGGRAGRRQHDFFVAPTCEVARAATFPGVGIGRTNADTVDEAAVTNVTVAAKPHMAIKRC